MQTLSIINLKGGVAKTTSSVNMAHILAAVHGEKVLLIDNDKQGNASKFLNRHDYEHAGMAEIMTERTPDMKKIIQHTDFPGLDVITANMNLLTANLKVMLDQQRPQQTRLKKALQQVSSEYDYCIIDNAPDINISTINALVASNTVMIPITIDPTPRAVIAAKSPNHDTPRRSVGIPIILPPIPITIPTIRRRAFFPFSTTARIDSADATPGGHAPSAGNISLSNVL